MVKHTKSSVGTDSGAAYGVENGNSNSDFWIWHLITPSVLFVSAMLLIFAFDLDTRWADTIYGWQGEQWSLKGHYITSKILHTYGQRFSILLGVFTILAGCASMFWAPLRRYRRGFAFVIVAMLFSLLLVSLSKHTLPIPCPWDIQRYGGALGEGGWLNWQPGESGISGCFPAGHAAGGFCLLAWYFFAHHYQFQRSAMYLLPGILVGVIFASAQELRGAHFISHDVTAAATCWFFSLLCYRMILWTSGLHDDAGLLHGHIEQVQG